MTKDNPEFTQAISRQVYKNHVCIHTDMFGKEMNLKVKKRGRHQTFSCKIKTGTAGMHGMA